MLTKPHYAKAETIEELAANFAEVENRIRAACRRAGGSEQSVRLLPVTKTVDERRLRMAYELGYRHFGENKVQEAWGKAEAMADLPIEWSVIGPSANQQNQIRCPLCRRVSGFRQPAGDRAA